MIKLLKRINIDYLFITSLLIYVVVLFILSQFRDMISDESLYYHETYLLSELFRNGEWIGNYGVGIHGFLFKIPPAIIFLLTGPSIQVVTIYHILLSGVVAFLMYRFSFLVLKKKEYAFLATILLICNFHFVISSNMYLREIPSILVVLLLLNSILKRKNNFILGLLFLILLDVKEYIFFIFALSYVFFLFIDSKEKKFFRKIIDVFKQSLIIFSPSLLWIVLMFTTSIIPVNMFLASTIGLLNTKFSYLLLHFNIEVSTYNALEGGMNIPLIDISDSLSPFFQKIFSIVNIFLSYLGKILYPRVFSFLSVPKVVIFPAIFTSILLLKEYLSTKKEVLSRYIFLSVLLLIWILIHILRASHGRYLLPIVPVISIFFVFLLFKKKFSDKEREQIIIGTLIYASAGYFFETTYVLHKVLLEFIAFILLFLSLYKPKLEYLKYILIVFLSAVSFGSAILFSYVQGQIYGYTKFGENRNSTYLSSVLPTEDRYWINNMVNQPLISTEKKETYIFPEWKWRLIDFLPKKEMLKTYGEERSYNFVITELDEFKSNIFEYKISKVVLIVTNRDFDYYPYQEYLNVFLHEDWLELDRKESSEDMEIFIFSVKE